MRAHWGLSPGAAVDFEVFLRGIRSEDRPKMQAALDRALDPTGNGQYHAEYRLIGHEDRLPRWIEARGQVIFEDGKAIRLTGTALDISERKAFQAELERQVQERTVSLQETVGELEAFSYSVSHDMRAPLRAMEGYAKALLVDYHDRLDSQGRHWLDRISRSAHRLDELIKDVLAYSRVAKEEIELGRVDLENVIEEIIATNPEFQPPRAHITIEKSISRVLGHEAYLMQCVTNLLGNAVKFVSDGVVPRIHIRSERLNGKVRIWFEDNGIGIDPAHHERIFQIFGQIYPQSKFGGTGIGLAIVRKAVQRMNGEVGVESTIDQGSRFWLVLNGEHYVEQASDVAH
jgi:signal transduction histidine kinase